jgi:formylglycine-generating enzyme required for sulfatase activity
MKKSLLAFLILSILFTVNIFSQNTHEKQKSNKPTIQGKFYQDEMVMIQPATFQQGNLTGYKYGDPDEVPVHEVIITNQYYIGKTEITQKQWMSVMNENPSRYIGDNLPVENVEWEDCIDFCNKLSDMDGLTRCYIRNGSNAIWDTSANGYRLPTEAEWEFACRAKTQFDYYNGNLQYDGCSPLDNNLDVIAWYCGNAGGKTHPVATKNPNNFGLFDMLGNVWEWMWDFYDSRYYHTLPKINPKGPNSGSWHTIKGDAYENNPYFMRCSDRNQVWQGFKYGGLGLRIAATGGCSPQDLHPEIASASLVTLCEGDSIYLNTKAKYAHYKWSTGDSTETIVVKKDGKYSVTVWNTKCDTSYSNIVEVKVNPKPNPAILADNTNICEGDSATLTVDNPYAVYVWNNGFRTRSIKVGKAGKYTVDVIDANGCKGRAEITVIVLPKPVPQIQKIGKECGDSLELMVSGNYAYYEWPDGSHGKSIIVKQSGTYSVIVIDENGCKGTNQIDVELGKGILPEIQTTKLLCEGDSCILTTKSPYKSYKWSTGETTPNITVKNQGQYSVHVIDSNGCEGMAEIIVIQNPNPKPEILLEGESCADTIKLSLTNDYSAYRWSTGETTKVIFVKQAGLYRVVVTDANGCVGWAEIDVKINPKPSPSILIAGNNPPCEGDTCILSSDKKYSSYSWSTGESSSSIKVTEDGTYKLAVTDENGCEGVAFIDVKFMPKPKPIISATDVSVPCKSDSIKLEANSGYSSYEWYDENGKLVGRGSSLVVRQSGKYYIKVKSADGCEGVSETKEVTFGGGADALEITGEFCNGEMKWDSTWYPELVCKKFNIKNVSSQPFILEDTYLSFNIAFSIPQSQLPMIIPPGESRELTVCFSPTEMNEQIDTIMIRDLCSIHKVPLRAIGTAGPYDGDSKCNVIIRGKVKKLPQNYEPIFPVLYPNPAGDFINIKTSGFNEQLSIEIYNLLGERVLNTLPAPLLLEREIKIDVSSLSSGLYFLKININEYSKFWGLVKE